MRNETEIRQAAPRTAPEPPKLAKVLALLPERIRREAESCPAINEIRLRAGRPASFLAGGKNIAAGAVITQEELDRVVTALCGGALHAHEKSIAEGYIDFMGCRVGVCGSRRINSVSIRIPYPLRGVGGELLRRLEAADFSLGALVYSPPGVGKTTLLRDIAAAAASPPSMKRVVLVDTRGELFDADMMEGCTIDVLDGVSKARGIEIATRTLNPELIVCDEISGDEGEAVLRAQNTGTPLLCSAHAASLEGLMRRPSFRLLAEAGVFSLFCGISRRPPDTRFTFDICSNMRMTPV